MYPILRNALFVKYTYLVLVGLINPSKSQGVLKMYEYLINQ